MTFGSWTYDGNKINLTSKDDSVDLRDYVGSVEWDLLGMRCCLLFLTMEIRYRVIVSVGLSPPLCVRVHVWLRVRPTGHGRSS